MVKAEQGKHMENQFGALIKTLMQCSGIKGRELADVINYDMTYISKWINGTKLPADRNIDTIIGLMADCFGKAYSGKDWGGLEIAPDAPKVSIERLLQNGYRADRNAENSRFHIDEKRLAFYGDKRKLIKFLRESFRQMSDWNTDKIVIRTTFDLFGFFGHRFKEVINELDPTVIQNVCLSTCMDTGKALEEYSFYCSNILDLIIEHRHVELSLYRINEADPKIIMINDAMYIQIMYEERGMFAACCSTDRNIVDHSLRYFKSFMEEKELLMNYTSSEVLRKTNVQLDSYCSGYQKQLFNEAPGSMFPPEIMDDLICACEDVVYRNYLTKLKTIFGEKTAKAQVDIFLYASVLSEYIQSGRMSIGNVAHDLTKEQVEAHIRYICKCMKNNPRFRVFLIRDTINIGMIRKYHPSLFLDEKSVSIENSQKSLNESYHISMDSGVVALFERYMTDIEKQSNCTMVTPEELERYL